MKSSVDTDKVMARHSVACAVPSGSCIVGVSRLYRYIDMYSYCS